VGQADAAFGSSGYQRSLPYKTDENTKGANLGAQLMSADLFASNVVGVDPGLFPMASGDFV
jgi:hypothetical protein